ncbi:MAG: ABC transporter ATP-binding protein/permease [Ruminococcaceae bacterium]|nr:ABC transporter ATP-binding protein/permease [Oscillospiraceae bacterium]
MLELKGIIKNYETGGETVEALKGIDLRFRKNEFVSILGQSGCGKTTLLNIIGGLDQYTEGDLVIDGVSTKQYKDRDWDSYRNHKIGFVFQSYNLIPHQTVLANVEIALSLSGVPKAERRRRAKEALEKVGLGDQLKKRPNQMSGGQMQRVAIARALVNDPDIILADEPTGALDTETSVQVMEILKEISKERLIIMVTHNPELAHEYSSRIIRMLDGNIIDDSNPLSADEISVLTDEDNKAIEERKSKKKEKKPSMSFATSFMLSLKNLFTKKGRTTLTAFAGSIGIIGIALILAVSQGTTTYIDAVQEEALSAYPLTLQSHSVDMSDLIKNFMNATSETSDHPNDAVYRKASVSNIINAFVNTMNDVKENDLKSFDNYIRKAMNDPDSELGQAINGVQYSYNLDLQIFGTSTDDTGDKDREVIIPADTNDLLIDLMSKYVPAELKQGMMSSMESSQNMSMMGMGSMMSAGLWQELLPANDGGPVNKLLTEQYDVIYGNWPKDYNEVVVVVDENNEINDMTLYALGLLNESEMKDLFESTFGGKTVKFDGEKWSYKDICSRDYRAVLNADCYKLDTESGLYKDMRDSDSQLILKELYDNGLPLKVTGIIRPKDDVAAPMLTGGICYTSDLTRYLITKAEGAEVIKAQQESPDYDVVTGLPFEKKFDDENVKSASKAFIDYIDHIKDNDQKKLELLCSINAYNGMIAELEGYKQLSKDELVNNVMTKYASMLAQFGMSEEDLMDTVDKLTKDELMVYIEDLSMQGVSSAAAGMLAQMSEEDKMGMLMGFDAMIASYTEEQYAEFFDKVITFSDKSYDENLLAMGYVDLDKPSAINIYAKSFEDKDVITAAIEKYNSKVDEEKQINYTDYIGIMLSSVTTIINAITYVLIAFVSISLIVSSIMIGVITLISVQERTKEIGILRAIGASKRNVSRMFNAETMIVGFTAGLLGVVVTYVLCIPINAILYALTDIPNLRAILPFPAALILIAISVFLTLISGIIPSRSAAKKDPVVALRTE